MLHSIHFMKEQNNLVFKLISPEETYPIRHTILRSGKPISSCIFLGDDLHTTIHIGGFYNNNLIAIVSLFKVKNLEISNKHSYQLRGMAILNEYQGKGYGKKIIIYAETILRKKGISIIWMNARESAIPFYITCGYSKNGRIFDIPNVGSHIVMCKNLNQ